MGCGVSGLVVGSWFWVRLAWWFLLGWVVRFALVAVVVWVLGGALGVMIWWFSGLIVSGDGCWVDCVSWVFASLVGWCNIDLRAWLWLLRGMLWLGLVGLIAGWFDELLWLRVCLWCGVWILGCFVARLGLLLLEFGFVIVDILALFDLRCLRLDRQLWQHGVGVGLALLLGWVGVVGYLLWFDC